MKLTNIAFIDLAQSASVFEHGRPEAGIDYKLAMASCVSVPDVYEHRGTEAHFDG